MHREHRTLAHHTSGSRKISDVRASLVKAATFNPHFRFFVAHTFCAHLTAAAPHTILPVLDRHVPCHLYRWIERIPRGTRENDVCKTGIMGRGGRENRIGLVRGALTKAGDVRVGHAVRAAR